MSEEELEEQIIQQIEVLVDELGGTMCHLTKCSYTGRQRKVIEIEYRVENIRIIPGSYDVVVSSKLLSKFSNSKLNLTYFIALEPDSTFG